jgi:hypothetical protein
MRAKVQPNPRHSSLREGDLGNLSNVEKDYKGKERGFGEKKRRTGESQGV